MVRHSRIDPPDAGDSSRETGGAIAPEGTVHIQAFTIYVEYSGMVWMQGVAFDDLDLEVVGENHGQYVSSISLNAGQLERAGLITESGAAVIVETAANSAGGPGPNQLASKSKTSIGWSIASVAGRRAA